MKGLAIDLFCGLGGWTDGLLAEGWDVIGFDCERHAYGDAKYPAQLVLQDVLTLDGAQFRNADLIVASPPCQEFSYMAMPWSRAKAKIGVIEACPAEWLRLCALFDACFRIQREACAASGRHIPLIVENVRGAQRWVGRSRWNFGSFHLWGDVPALMPMTFKASKVPGFRFDGEGGSFQTASVNGAFKTQIEQRLQNRIEHATEGVKTNLSGHAWYHQGIGSVSSKSNARKAASAMIAKIPFALSSYIGRHFKPQAVAA